MDFNALKDKYKDNEGLMSDLSQIESAYTTLEAKKENAVDEVKKFKGFKHSIADTIGLDKEISIDDLQGNLKGRLTDFQEKIDSFKNNASSKELENAQFKEDFAKMQNSINEANERYETERTQNKLNDLTNDFRKSLTKANIKTSEAQEMAIDAYINKAGAVEDLDLFAKSIAEQRPFLTTTSHKGGSGTFPSRETNTTNGLADIKINDKQGRLGAINALIEANPNKG